MTDQKEIDEILALDERRTPGEWVDSLNHTGRDRRISGDDAPCIAETGCWEEREEMEANAQFIAAAPRMAAIIRELWEESRELRKENGRLREEIKRRPWPSEEIIKAREEEWK